MDEKNVNSKKVEEPSIDYKSLRPQQGIGEDFDFEKEFAKGLTIEEAKKLSRTLISKWWKGKM